MDLISDLTEDFIEPIADAIPAWVVHIPQRLKNMNNPKEIKKYE